MGMAERAIAAVAASFIRIFPSFRVFPVLICFARIGKFLKTPTILISIDSRVNLSVGIFF